MILPSKYIQEDEALLGLGAKILSILYEDKALSELWEETKAQQNVSNYERFVLALDMLYVMGLIIFEDQKIKRIAK